MKKTILILAIFSLFVSCKQAQKGKVELKNGEDKIVSVPYEIATLSYDKFITLVSKDQFTSITEKASSEAKMKCKYMQTYEPKSVFYYASNDTISVTVDFTAKNAFGVPDFQMSFSKFIGDKLLVDESIKNQADELEKALEDALNNK